MDRAPLEFRPTRWSLVRSAGAKDEEGRAALESLCTDYWYPVYGYLRRTGASHDDALDWTQGFFLSLIERASIDRADPERGRFRTYLLACLRNYVSTERAREGAQKRGGGAVVSLDASRALERFDAESPMDDPEQAFDRAWTRCLLESVITKLALEWSAAGKGELFARLKGLVLLGPDVSLSYAEIAAELGSTEGAIKAQAHQLRKRYRELLRREMAQTVTGEEELEEEILALFRSLEP